MGYDRWMLSPISRGEASQDNERAVGGGGGGRGGGEGELGKHGERELRSHMVGWCVCVRGGGVGKGPRIDLWPVKELLCCHCQRISIYIWTGFQVRKIQSELRLTFYSTTYHSPPICPHSPSPRQK